MLHEAGGRARALGSQPGGGAEASQQQRRPRRSPPAPAAVVHRRLLLTCAQTKHTITLVSRFGVVGGWF